MSEIWWVPGATDKAGVAPGTSTRVIQESTRVIAESTRRAGRPEAVSTFQSRVSTFRTRVSTFRTRVPMREVAGTGSVLAVVGEGLT